MKILYTILLITLFRVAASITIPGVSVASGFADDSSSFLGILNTLGGGGLARLSIVALGISPFITASIIMQLFQSDAFPPLYRLARSGPRGKRKINVITRVITLVFAVMQAIVLISQFNRGGFLTLKDGYDTKVFLYFVLPMILVGGSLFSLFLGEQITNKGVGNGTSLIIFSGIAAMLPRRFQEAWYFLSHSYSPYSYSVIHYNPLVPRINAAVNFILYFGIFWLMIYVLTMFYNSRRYIPIQQTGAGMTTDVKHMSKLPIKVNPSGVMPIIFPMMLISIPGQIAQFLSQDNPGRIWIQSHLRLTDPLGMAILVVLIAFFSIGMALVTFNPMQISDNFKKQGTFIPGIRPGDETEEYITKVVIKLGTFSAIYLSVISVFKYVMEIVLHSITKYPIYGNIAGHGGLSQIAYGGTTMLILVSVAVETINQLKARDTSHKISRARQLSSQGGDDNTEGLLW